MMMTRRRMIWVFHRTEYTERFSNYYPHYVDQSEDFSFDHSDSDEDGDYDDDSWPTAMMMIEKNNTLFYRTENADCCPDYYPHCLGSNEPQWVNMMMKMVRIRLIWLWGPTGALHITMYHNWHATNKQPMKRDAKSRWNNYHLSECIHILVMISMLTGMDIWRSPVPSLWKMLMIIMMTMIIMITTIL